MRVRFLPAVLLTAALFMLDGTTYGQPKRSAAPEVVQPNGGEIWYKGSLQTVAWKGSSAGQVGIELFRGSVLKKNIGTVDASSGLFLWKVASDLPAGDDYRIKIVQGSVSDFSDGYFSIQIPPARGNPRRLIDKAVQRTIRPTPSLPSRAIGSEGEPARKSVFAIEASP